MEDKNRSIAAKLICIHPVCLCALVILCLVRGTHIASAKSSGAGNDVPGSDFKVERRPGTASARDAGEFYRVPGGKIRLLRSLKKVAVHHGSERDITNKVSDANRGTRRLFAVEQRPARGRAVLVSSTDISSLAELDETISQLQQEPDIDQITPVYINEETGLEMVPTGEFIVKLAPEATLQQLRALNRSMGVSLVRRLRGTTDQFILSLDPWTPQELLALCETYHHHSLVVWASPNFLSQVKRSGVVDDPVYHENQWHLEKIEAADAWNITTGSQDIVVAVIDDGVDIDHPDLRSSFSSSDADHSDNGYSGDAHGWDFASDDNDPRASQEDDNHGTRVAGIIAAQGNNGLGVLGCAPNCRLMALRVVDGEDWASDAVKAQAILYAAGFHADGVKRWHGADVINISLTFNPHWAVNDALRKAATEGRMGKGCPIFCGSGNNDWNWDYWSVWGFPSGTYTMRWEYLKAASDSPDSGAVWLDNVKYPGGEVERFEGGKPSAWNTGRISGWTSVQNGVDRNHAMTGWDGQHSKSMRSGPVDMGRSSWLETTRFLSEGTLKFWFWHDMKPGEEFTFTLSGAAISTYSKTFSSLGTATQDDLPVIAYPASHPDTIAVGASSNFDFRADYSQYGLGLDFVAPSGGGSKAIHTTDRMDTDDQINGVEGDYDTDFGGTSAASPLAAGVGALMLSANPELTAMQIRDILQDTCDKIGNVPYREPYENDPNTNRYYGHGRVNARLAVNAAHNLNPHNGPAGMVFVSITEEGTDDGGGFNGQMSKYETTNAQYCAYLNAALSHGLIVVHDDRVYAAHDPDHTKPYLGTHAALADSQIVFADGSFSVRRRDGHSMDDHPVLAVSWFGARAFCSYYGLRLPTQAEWQAVADYDGSYAYGCGPSIDQGKANYYDQRFANPLGLTEEPYTSPVGHYGAYGYGLSDMAGNVWEWASTLSSNGYRLVCGGSWWDSDCSVLGQYHVSPYNLNTNIGFRVCR